MTALYSNIGHEKGVQCVEEIFAQDPEIPELQRWFLIDAVTFILPNNYFLYDGSINHQVNGTAKGTCMAPSYANLFMGSFESKFILEMGRSGGKGVY